MGIHLKTQCDEKYIVAFYKIINKNVDRKLKKVTV